MYPTQCVAMDASTDGRDFELCGIGQSLLGWLSLWNLMREIKGQMHRVLDKVKPAGGRIILGGPSHPIPTA